jgi:hypothetical protein
MKEIVRWAIVGEDGSFLMSFPCEETAECSGYNRSGNTIVKLTGQMPEKKRMKTVAQYVYRIDDMMRVSDFMVTREEAEEGCRRCGNKLWQWPWGLTAEVEE